ncbi:115_t:CDS:2 [Funneliformis caledonium]|uniref:115_t:CDS:1 n=1 Tax=Funneliformis caledonium TaxID=1117310 RepID=A0A9N9FFI2_9GLOM|nr:115_t:CDS:2 [Funneliformis caledonium]
MLAVKPDSGSISNTRKHVPCHCNICKCRKVDPRTRKLHTKEKEFGSREFVESSRIASPSGMTEDILSDHMNTDVDIVNDDLISQEFNFLVMGPKLSDDPASDQEFNFFIISSKSSKGKQKQLGGHISFLTARYWLSDTATNSLIKFMRYLLLLVDRNIYSEFPKSLHIVRKLFGISDHMIKYATCKKCCKIYAVKDLTTDKPYYCTFKDFLNHPMTKLRSPCSFHNSNRHIEPKLLKIVQNYSRLDELSLFVNENQHLLECLPYIALKETVSSLTANEDFDLMKYSEFLTMSKNVKEKVGTGLEPFSGALLKPMKSVKLSSEILALLVEYYNNACNNSFVSLSDIYNSLPGTIAVFPQINQFGRLRLEAEDD